MSQTITNVFPSLLTWVYLKTKSVMMKAGSQQMERGIQSGLVKIIRMSIQKERPSNMKSTLDWRKISSINIMEKSMNLRRNLAVLRSLKF